MYILAQKAAEQALQSAQESYTPYTRSDNSLSASILSVISLTNTAWKCLMKVLTAASSTTRCPAGMALLAEDGAVYRGGVIESCAYNPTINPLQAAYITLVARGKRPFSEVCKFSAWYAPE